MAAKEVSKTNPTSGPPSLIKEQKLREIFDSLDRDKDGKVDSSELIEGFRKLGVPNTVLSANSALGRADTNNKDDLMDFNEFTQYCLANEQQLWRVFQQLDKNHDGEIDAEEVKLSLKLLGLDVSDADVRQLLVKMDKDGNVRISWEEWREFLLLQPDTSIKSIFKYWSHGSVVNIGEALDNILMPDEFTAEEKTTGLWWRQLVAGGGAGAVSRTVTAPLDRLKIFFQIGGEGRTIASCFSYMVKEGGVRSLWRGNGVNVVKIVPESALRFFAYEQLKNLIHTEGQQTQVHERLLAGSTAGVISQTTVYPMEVLKTRLALGKTGQYRGMFDCARQIFRNEGLRAFYRGLTPSLIGIIPYAGIDLTVYETLKNLWLKEHSTKDPGVLLPLICGTISSTCGQLASYPLSLVRTRLQAQVGPPGQQKLGVVKMLQTIYHHEGLPGMYRGIVPNFLKVIPAVSIGYVAYEQFKMLLHVRT